MDADQAELLATEPLESLAVAIGDLSGRVGLQLTDVQDDLMPRLRRLDRLQEAARGVVRRAEEAVSRAEDEASRRSAEEWLERAEEAERALDDAMERVQDALDAYKSAAADLESARSGAFPQAASFLRSKIAAANAYAAIQVSPTLGRAAPEQNATARLQADADLEEIALPAGLAWIPIAGIHPDEFVDFVEEPAKAVSRNTMAAGMRRFYTDLVPMLRSNPRVSRDELRKRDRERGTLTGAGGLIHPESLSNLGEIFLFGDDLIAVEAGGDGLYRLHSGRHRATLARDLGMTHIPAWVPDSRTGNE
jgi:hypothetical protein